MSSVFDNKRYKMMELEDGVYVPETGIDYPEDDNLIHLHPMPKEILHPIDENYPYLDRSFKFKVTRAMFYFAANTVIRLANWFIYGFSSDKSALKPFRKQLKNGAISIANHQYRWDAGAIAITVHKRFWIPVYAEHLKGKDYFGIKNVGGIPVPEDIASMRKFNEAFDYYATTKAWIHVFPEATSWRWYKPIKPFYKGAFSMAYKYNRPIVPSCFVFQPRKGFRKYFHKDQPFLKLVFGTPIFPDKTKPRKMEVDRLRLEAHQAIVKLAGIKVNSWPAVPENDV